MWFFNKKKKLYKAFEAYVPKEVIDKIIENSPKELDDILKGTSKFLSISFTNINGYVGTAEQLELKDLKLYMDKYYDLITNIVIKNDGVIDKYEGDNIFTEYGLFEKNNICQRACISALEQMDIIEKEFNPWAEKNKYPRLNIRIGIGSGDLIVGNFGDSKNGIYDFTAMGDAVNIASYLTEKSKNFSPRILIDEITANNTNGFELGEMQKEKNYNYFHFKGQRQ